MSTQTSVVLGACRIPTGKFQGALSPFTAPQLGALAVKEAVNRSGVPADDIGECIMGCVLQAGLGQNPARQAQLGAGLPPQAGAMTVNKVCGSSLKAVVLGTQGIALGEYPAMVAGGMESMTNAPFILPKARDGYRLGHGKLVDLMINDGLWEAYEDYHMGSTAELVCREYNVTREEQDQYAFESQQKAVAAWEAGHFKKEVVPVEIPQRKKDPILFEKDEGPRAETTLESLAKLRPVFEKDGSVTAGNSSTINDGSAALVLGSEQYAEKQGLKPMARIVASSVSGLEPKWVMMTPRPAIEMVLEKAGWSMGDVDLFEINEAFAAQQVALRKLMEIPAEKHNIWGGGVALGHPIGASGARILVTLISALHETGGKKGVAALCMGGANGVAVAVETV